MAPILFPRVLNGGAPNLDPLGVTYVVMTILYTLLLSGELYLLYRHRTAFCVQIRNLKVVFGAVSMLQVYLVLVLLVYPENGLFPCSAEFWIMSIFLPSGMAFFQACNARVLKAYESQRRLKRNFLEGARKKRLEWTPRGLYEAWLDLDAAAKVYVGTVVGLIISFIPTIILFFGSRRFHASYGFFGPVVDSRVCRQGAEWIPSIFVQLFWTALVGPWILWKIRRVNDVHSWAWQTRLAILAGLPGTPLWLAFTYAKIPGMVSINRYFATAGWFIPSLVVCQQVLIIIPLRDAWKSQARRTSISSTSTTETLHSTRSSISTKSPRVVLSKELRPKASMQALEFCVDNNIEPLISWAASREFTAENTIFLREVRNWKKKWAPLTTVTTAQRRQMFTEASLIFFTLINPFTAETPINIEYKIFRSLQSLFATVEFDPYRPTSRVGTPDSTQERENVVCPWEDVLNRPTSIKSDVSASSTASTRSLVPSQFTENIFDAAFESIKYLVFTNTWPRYVEAEMAGNASP
ncbi:uncharacterized protein BDR25DRAFT_237380 [Lindgomyces ingoldianus]|uniref:Uncharacterized protein n=1 Tax=Lindgomyces ingoldianus TaxID=673940 RepID=A0ACB6QH56_9PLEO|nr:uncharacterized protein BDR25DRAFT_237380 [Lindgomyces ingoldianus]KAF2466308.1 hypothetical protein BDR25DRAFT_237380 [Lindgomyces ingoldianus]